MTPVPLYRPSSSFSQGTIKSQHSSRVQKQRWPPNCQGKEPRGLHNDGVMCYRRAVTQSLFHLPAFLQFIEKHQQSKMICKAKICRCVTCGLKSLSAAYWTGHSTHHSKTRLLDDIINKKAREEKRGFMWDPLVNRYCPGNQQDAAEFLTWMVNQMRLESTDTSNGKEQNDPKSEPKTRLTEGEKPKDDIEILFGLRSQKKMVCHECGTSRKFHSADPVIGPLPLAISTLGKGRANESTNLHKTLRFYLDQYFRTEFYDIKCENKKCKMHNHEGVKNQVTHTITDGPEILTIQLMCFESNGNRSFKKLRSHVKYSQWLDLTAHTSKRFQKKEGNLTYRLSSVIFHRGGSLHSGHYTCTVQAPTGVFTIDDREVHRATLSDMIPDLADMRSWTTPYILTYVRTRVENKVQSTPIQLPSPPPTTRPQHNLPPPKFHPQNSYLPSPPTSLSGHSQNSSKSNSTLRQNQLPSPPNSLRGNNQPAPKLNPRPQQIQLLSPLNFPLKNKQQPFKPAFRPQYTQLPFKLNSRRRSSTHSFKNKKKHRHFKK